MLQCNRTRASLEVLPFELHYCFVHKLVLLFLQWLCNDEYAAFVFLFGLCATNFNFFFFFFFIYQIIMSRVKLLLVWIISL